MVAALTERNSDLLGLVDKHRAVVVQIDAFDGLDLLPRLSIDLTITDPPYESLERHRKRGTTTRLKESERSSNPWFAVVPNGLMQALFRKLFDVHKKDTHAYCFCDSETEHVILSASNPYDSRSTGQPSGSAGSVGWRPWPTLTWVKTKRRISSQLLSNIHKILAQKGVEETAIAAQLAEAVTSTGMGYHWRRSKEHIILLEKGKRSLNNQVWTDVLYGPGSPKGKAWPAQKPERLVERLILNSTGEGDVVLDPFVGSGTTLAAAIRNGRRAVGFDVNPKACEATKARCGAFLIKGTDLGIPSRAE